MDLAQTIDLVPVAPWLWQYALETVTKYNMDESHGMTHFLRTRAYAQLIMDSEEFNSTGIIPGLTKAAEKILILDAAFVHDLIDSKYMDEAEAIERLTKVLITGGYSASDANAIITIITQTSFSKRLARHRAGLPMIEPGPYYLAVCIVTDADQLDGYDPHRCRIYQEHRTAREFPEMNTAARDHLCRSWQRTVLSNRVLLYKTVYMNTQAAKNMAIPLHEITASYIRDNLDGADLLDYP